MEQVCCAMRTDAQRTKNKNSMSKKTVEVIETQAVVGSKGRLGCIVIDGKAHSVISVMRAMGYNGWTLPELNAAIEAHIGQDGLLLAPAEHTRKLALKRGRDEKAVEGGAGGRKIADVSDKALRAWAGIVKEKAKKKGKGGSKKSKKEAVVAEGEHEKDGLTESEVVQEAVNS